MIVPSPALPEKTELMALESRSWNVSDVSATASELSVMLFVFCVSPKAKVSLPLVERKSPGAVAVPLVVAKLPPTWK